MTIIALTGGIGSGKSTVAEILKIMGYPAYHSDDAAKSLYSRDPVLRKEITEIFGEDVYAGQQINQKKLADMAFNNERMLKQLNDCVHPAVMRDFSRWRSRQTAETVVFETALSDEAAAYLHFDRTIVVTAPKEVRMQRVMQRSLLSEQEITARMSHQADEKTLLDKADGIIYNGLRDALIPQVLKLFKPYNNNPN